MPVRFQVDGDFYDHPKSLGLSDAAVALWTRAGSYSAAKLTDGFIVEHVLVLLSRTPQEAAEELVARGLWQRTKGGFRFHQWDHRNLTKERVELERAEARLRKREQRKRTRKQGRDDEEPQVRPQIVPVGLTGGVTRESHVSHSGVTRDGLDTDTDTDKSVSGLVSSIPPKPPRGGRARAYGYDADTKFGEFWGVYPIKKGKPNAFKAWQQALARGADPDVIIEAARRYRDDPARNPQMTKYPQGWLSDERYNDQPEPRVSGGWWDN